MKEDVIPSSTEVFNNHHPNKRYRVRTRSSMSDGHTHDPDNWVGGIPKNTPYMTVTCAGSGWNSDFWDELQEAYENEGFTTHLRESSGTTRTRSGTCKHAATQLYIWSE